MRTSHRLTHLICLVSAMIVLAAASLAQAVGNGFVANANANPADSVVQVSDQKAGSILVFPFYGSDGTTANDTRLTITNVGPAGFVGAPAVAGSTGSATDVLNNEIVHLFWIDSTCAQADGYVCFTKYQSWTFKASEWDPVTKSGILIAVSVDPQGFPVSYNGLIGNAFVNCNVTQGGNTERWLGNYGAEAFASLGTTLAAPLPNGQVYWYTSPATPNNPTTTAQLFFNNSPRFGGAAATGLVAPAAPLTFVGYDAAANGFAVEFQSPADSTGQTVLTVGLNGTIGTTLTGGGLGGNNVGQIFRNDEKEYSFTGPTAACQTLIRISSTNPRVLGGLGVQIASGKTGTMLWSTTGGSIGLFVTPSVGNNAWIGIRGLHKRSVTPGVLVMPVFVPTCIV